MNSSVETLCPQLVRCGLLSQEAVQDLLQRWRAEAGPAAGDLERFGKWLVAHKHATEYQLRVLLKGHAGTFFFNKYKLLDRIGRGHMAGVYKAVHELGQVVALKVLPPSKARDPQAFGRFQREARLAVPLKHPNVVRTFQKGEANGLHYIVTEYLEGETLDEVLQRRGKLPVDEAVRVVYQALLGLQHLHEHDMVHRDLQPANLMIVPARQVGQPDTTLQTTVKVLNIGLGRALFDEGDEEDEGGTLDLTVRGDKLGAPYYVAPEQARDAHGVDIRADIYTLGCVLYQSLGGQRPFANLSLKDLVCRTDQKALRPLQELNPAVPGQLQQIVTRMLAADPAQRFPTPEQAAQALQSFLTREKEAAPPAAVNPQARSYLEWLDKEDRLAGHGPAAAKAEPATSAGPPLVTTEPFPAHLTPKQGPVPPSPAVPPRARYPQPPSTRSDAGKGQTVAFTPRSLIPPPASRPPAPTLEESVGGVPLLEELRQKAMEERTEKDPAPLPPRPVKRTATLKEARPASEIEVQPLSDEEVQELGVKGPWLGRRDWLMLGIGAGCMLLLVIIISLVAHALRSRE